MKLFNLIIWKNILEIIIIIMGVYISIPLWKTFDMSEYASLAMYYANMNFITIEAPDIDQFKLVSSTDDVDNIGSINFSIINDTYTLNKYNIYLRISRKSSIDYENLMLSIDSIKSNISSFKHFTDGDYYYVALLSGELVANREYHTLKLWIDNNTVVNCDGSLIFDIVNLERRIL